MGSSGCRSVVRTWDLKPLVHSYLYLTLYRPKTRMCIINQLSTKQPMMLICIFKTYFTTIHTTVTLPTAVIIFLIEQTSVLYSTKYSIQLIIAQWIYTCCIHYNNWSRRCRQWLDNSQSKALEKLIDGFWVGFLHCCCWSLWDDRRWWWQSGPGTCSQVAMMILAWVTLRRTTTREQGNDFTQC